MKYKSEYMIKWREKNRDRLLAYKKKYNQEHKHIFDPLVGIMSRCDLEGKTLEDMQKNYI